MKIWNATGVLLVPPRVGVHLIGDAKRDELMIIYIEDLSPQGLTAANLASVGSAASKWEELSKGLLERAQKNMKVLR